MQQDCCWPPSHFPFLVSRSTFDYQTSLSGWVSHDCLDRTRLRRGILVVIGYEQSTTFQRNVWDVVSCFVQIRLYKYPRRWWEGGIVWLRWAALWIFPWKRHSWFRRMIKSDAWRVESVDFEVGIGHILVQILYHDAAHRVIWGQLAKNQPTSVANCLLLLCEKWNYLWHDLPVWQDRADSATSECYPKC